VDGPAALHRCSSGPRTGSATIGADRSDRPADVAEGNEAIVLSETVTRTEPGTAGMPFERLYVEVQQFYAEHMHYLDAGEADEWAATFTEDGVFAPPSLPEPVRGRAALAEGVRRQAAKLAGLGERHRHCFLMQAVTPLDHDTVQVRSYTQVIATPRDGQPRLDIMCECHDVLVRENGRWRIRERRVTRDDRP
jgi:hypothetical protein